MRLKLPTTTISGIILLVVGVSTTACHPRPDVTASSREEAMERCLNDVGKEFEKVKEERARAKADQKSASFKTNENIYDEYKYTFLLDSEFRSILLTQAFCRPSGNKYHKDLWHNVGYIEYLERPTDKSFAVETKVDKVVVSYGYTWKEKP